MTRRVSILPSWLFAIRCGAAAVVAFDKMEKKFCNVRVGAIGIGDRPIRLNAAERALEGREMTEAAIAGCAAAASRAVDPPDDIHASGAYRKTLIGVMVERALRDAGRMSFVEVRGGR